MKTVGVTTCQADVGADMILIGSNDDVWILMAAGFILEYGGECGVCGVLLRGYGADMQFLFGFTVLMCAVEMKAYFASLRYW